MRYFSKFLAKSMKLAAAIVLTISSSSPTAWADSNYPNKAIHFVVPAAAGGPTDIVTRLIASKMSVSMGVPVIVEAKPGAGGNIGADYVARATPDGYTILMGTLGTHAVNQTLYKKLPFDPIKDFAPVTQAISYPLVVVVNPKLDIHSIKDLIKYAQAHPDKLNRASGGSGTSMHLSGELFNTMAKTKMQHIPYKGSAPALTDVMGGQADLAFDSIVIAKPLIESGKLRAIGVTSKERSPALPNVPAIDETVPGYSMASWIGVLAPAHTPKAVVERLQQAIAKALKVPEVTGRLQSLAAQPVGSTPEEFTKFIKSETAKWAPVVKETGAIVG